MKKLLALAIFLLLLNFLSKSCLAKDAERKTYIVEFFRQEDYEILKREGKILKDFKIINSSLVIAEWNDVQRFLSFGRIYENKKVRAFLHDSAQIIFAQDAWEGNLNGKDVKICILDTGIDYKHSAIDNCDLEEIIDGNYQPYVLESPHPYPANFNYTWEIKMPGFSRISIHFVNISVEFGYDFIYIMDKDGNVVQTFSGNYKDLWTVPIEGDTVKINLVSDWYMSLYGFYIDKVVNGSVSRSLRNCTRIIAAYNFINGNEDVYDDNGHGTHVAGIIASNDSYSKGIAYGAKLLIGKVLDSNGEGTYSTVIEGIEWCLNNSAQVISLSLGGDYYTGNCDSDLLAKAVNSVVEKNVVVVAAAGNLGGCGIATPACASKAIAVGAVDKSKNVAGFSGRGSELDLLAPGVSINSTLPSNKFGYSSGTSMAAPHVAGAAAILLQLNLNLSPSQIK